MKIKKIISAIMATAMVASVMTGFSVFATTERPDYDPDETGNSKSAPISIEPDETINEKLSACSATHTSVDHDWYSFSLDTPSKVNITVNSQMTNNSSASNKIYYEVIDVDNDNAIIYTINMLNDGDYDKLLYLSAGNYHIHFCSNYFGNSCNYTLKLESTPTEESFDSRSNNNIGNASPVELDTTYTGQISANDDADYYTFDLAEEGMVTINFDGNFDNVDWKIYNSDEEVVQKGTFTKAGKDDAISAMKQYIMTAGTFTIGITKNGESCGNYTLSLDYLKDYNNRTVSGVFACADINKDGFIDANDASVVLSYYAYLSTGGTESDMNVWYKTEFAEE